MGRQWYSDALEPAPSITSEDIASDDLNLSLTSRREWNVSDQSENVALLLQEMRRRDLSNANRKRKASEDSEEPAISSALSPVSNFRARSYQMWQAEASDSSEASSPESTCSPDPNPRTTPCYYEAPVVTDRSKLNILLPECFPRLPHAWMEELSLPLSGWNPTTMTMSPPRPSSLESPSNQELMSAYLKVSAKRLADTSPSYIDLFRKYVPAMAHDSPALLEAMLALAAVNIGLMRKDSRLISVDAALHYHRALRHHIAALEDPESRAKDALLATSILLSHYEIWNGENVKMGVHMIGGRNIILARGKAAHMTPVGRALYAAFKRLDIATSSITGNPTFMTKDWWTVDPYTRTPIPDERDVPTLLVADAALSKLCVICCKLTHLKAWATRRRRRQWVLTGGSPSAEEKEQLQHSINVEAIRLEDEVDDWKAELPPWFDALVGDPATGENCEEEDINATNIAVISPRRYPHISVALVHAWAISVRLQLYRIRYPDMPVVPKKFGSLCHALLRIFKFLPSSTDAAMVVPLFAVGMELRQRCHQEWLANLLQERMDETGFHGINFLRDGLRFAWMKFEGMNNGRFIRIPEGAASKIEGVSENLWSAEGMLGTFEKISLYDSPDTTGERKNFKGDIDTSGYGDDVLPYEVADTESTSAEDAPVPPKRLKSESPESDQRSDDGDASSSSGCSNAGDI
ncbi:hypothetical protein RUND412_006046 [Rhizina undulata]